MGLSGAGAHLDRPTNQRNRRIIVEGMTISWKTMMEVRRKDTQLMRVICS
jgi:hypothetical protein